MGDSLPSSTTDDDLAAVADALTEADVAVALTGAGVSTASGVPSFRGEGGIWRTEFDPGDFRIGRFDADPAGFWRDRLRLHEAMFPESVAPNAAHEALARLEREGFLDAVITQNTDGLHAEAGSDRVLELHGTGARVVCRDCGRREEAAPVRERVRTGELPPRCDGCGGVYKPDVVLFGEALPRETFAEARRLAADSDVFLAVGSSLTVEPAASLPGVAAEGGTLVLVNREETPYSDRAHAEFRADAAATLSKLAELVSR
ncbi:SIR2 family NAD-dependent protein deacylase [Halegenticoccus tardaugens]|uniref:SIR2 family NAD-dependent protein deacylase n=1 Tax=Halegenticoccus tardaugens TaxID=2071624 RepID=UPI00100AE582|nr:Sir2 family NAD-dependent protein deacetylase [Halegenticoccus tardaugens]